MNDKKIMPTRQQLYGDCTRFRTIPADEYEYLLGIEDKYKITVQALQKISKDFNKSHHNYCYIAKNALEQTDNWFIKPIVVQIND